MGFVDIQSVSIHDRGLRAAFVSNASLLEAKGELRIDYPFALRISDDDVEQIVLSTFLPLASVDGPIVMRAPFDLVRGAYWRAYLARFAELSQSLSFERRANNVERGEGALLETVRGTSNVGILFGGGVESLFGLFKLASLNPHLFAVVGPGFMNNDHARSSIKEEVEARLQADMGVRLHRVETNARRLWIVSDDAVPNKLCTGLLFYFYMRPMMAALGVELLLKVSEFEEAQNFSDYDQSINPRFLSHISDGPVFVPFLNAYSKIQMFEELSRTPYFDYVYSCLNNTDKRWCGRCSKCRRLAEYGRRLGIDTGRIGLDPSIEYVKETSPIGRNYAAAMDRVAPRRPNHHSAVRLVAKLLRGGGVM